MHSVRPQDQQKSLMRLLSSTDMKTFCKRWSSKLNYLGWELLFGGVLTALGFRRNLASTRNSKRGAAGLVVVVRHRHAGFAVCCPQGSRRCDREAIGLSGKGSAAGYALKE
jgi:hypothetical protein